MREVSLGHEVTNAAKKGVYPPLDTLSATGTVRPWCASQVHQRPYLLLKWGI